MKRYLVKTAGLMLNALAVVAPRYAARLGFELFCYPFRTPMTKKQKSFLATGLYDVMDHNDIGIQTYRWGNGPRQVLLLHGWQSHTYRWKKFIESLDFNQYTIHAFDAPGHGLSAGRQLHVPMYSEIINKMADRIGTVDVVIGHSLGGFSAMYTFRHHPQVKANQFIALASPSGAREFFRFFQSSLALSDRCIHLIEAYFVKLLAHTPDYYWAPDFATTLNVPGLIIHDDDDDETSVVNAQRIHDAWKTSQLIRTKGLGHNLRSEQVVADVVNFIKLGQPAMTTAN